MEHPALKTSGLDDRHELKELYEQDPHNTPSPTQTAFSYYLQRSKSTSTASLNSQLFTID